EGRGAEPEALLRGRELRTVHALPGGHAEGGNPDAAARVGRAPAGRAVAHDDGGLDLRPRPGGTEPAALGDPALPGGPAMTDPITFFLDGREVTARPGETIWQVAKREGTAIPHLCHAD